MASASLVRRSRHLTKPAETPDGMSPSLEIHYSPKGRADNLDARLAQSGELRVISDFRSVLSPSARSLSSHGCIPHLRTSRAGMEGSGVSSDLMISSHSRSSFWALSQSTDNCRPNALASRTMRARPAAGVCSTHSETGVELESAFPRSTVASRG